ncbi:hypothetical protein M3J09_001734 [Ascochyta lentis]
MPVCSNERTTIQRGFGGHLVHGLALVLRPLSPRVTSKIMSRKSAISTHNNTRNSSPGTSRGGRTRCAHTDWWNLPLCAFPWSMQQAHVVFGMLVSSSKVSATSVRIIQ